MLKIVSIKESIPLHSTSLLQEMYFYLAPKKIALKSPQV